MEIRGKTEGREEKTQQKKEGKGWTGPAEEERKAPFPKIRERGIAGFSRAVSRAVFA